MFSRLSLPDILPWQVKEYPIHHSNVQLYSKEKQVSSRVGHKMNEAGKKVRYLLKTGEIVD